MILGSALFWGVVFTLLWARQLKTKNATSVDAAWALGVGVQTVFLAWISEGTPSRRLLVSLLVGVWSLRLAGYLWWHRVRTGIEDGRYLRFRQKYSPGVFWLLYMVQAFLVFLLPFSFWGAFQRSTLFPGWGDGVALVLWAGALLGESLADRQLARFRANPENRGKTCRNGLWRYSRHPNYFFEWLLWTAYLPLSLASGGGWVSLLGPVLLYFLLTRVSGVPLTEEQALLSRGDDYRAYQKTTPAFFPWFPKDSR